MAKKLVPESKIAFRLRKLKWKIDEYRCAKNYTISNNVASFKTDKVLGSDLASNQEILFPNYRSIAPLFVHFEMPGYFQIPLIKPGSIVVDAGAYPGDFTVVASRMVGDSGKVYALEPNPKGQQYLEEMLKLNKVTNVEILPIALNDSPGRLNFFLDKDMFLDVRFNNSRYGQIEYCAETATLDDLFKNVPIDFIKMDIEGAELNAIAGGRKLIRDVKPSLAIASYHIVNGEQTAIALTKILKKEYSNVQTVYPMHQTTYAFNIK
ncbi:MAG: FkbM family methyltransferase [Candidatus Woesearchaeota archaeon]